MNIVVGQKPPNKMTLNIGIAAIQINQFDSFLKYHDGIYDLELLNLS